MTTKPPNPQKIAQLREVLEQHAQRTEGNFFDHHAEELKAKVRNRALLLLDQRARSAHELHSRLVAAEFEPDVVSQVVEDLKRVGLVDDEHFAREWVRQRHAARGKSARALAQELRQKGVADTHIHAALAQITSESEEEQVRALVNKKARSVREVPADYKEREKILRRLVGAAARRGYGASLSLRIAREALDARLAELES